MKIGDYVRTKNYGIAKILNTYNNTTTNYSSITLDKIDSFGRLGVSVSNNDIIKSSPNIIELFEEHDLVVIEYYSLRYNERVTRLFEVTYKDNKNIILENAKCSFMLTNNDFNDKDKKFEPIIKSIVTKEQFESMEYKVGE